MEKDIKDLAEICQESELIFDGRVLHLYHDRVSLPDGNSAMREYCRHNGGVAVIPINEDNEVLCVKQYRYPHACVTLEIPAGKLESKDSDTASAALRELSEETGAVCDKLTYLGEIYPSPAIMDEVIYLYIAEGLHSGTAHLDEDEFLSCECIPLSTLYDMVMRGEIKDAKTQIAILKAYSLKKTPVSDKA